MIPIFINHTVWCDINSFQIQVFLSASLHAFKNIFSLLNWIGAHIVEVLVSPLPLPTPPPPQNLRYKKPATFSGKLYRSVVNSFSVCAILWSLKEALDIDLKVTLGVFKHIFSSHALQEISNRKTLKSQQAFTRINFSFKFILLSELSIPGMEKVESGKLPLKNHVIVLRIMIRGQSVTLDELKHRSTAGVKYQYTCLDIKLYRSVVNSFSVCAILWSLKEALDIDLKVTLGVFKHIFSSHAQNEISNRKTLKSQQAFTRVNFSFKFILLSELSISGMEKDECGKLPLKKLIVLSHDTRSISHYMSWNIVRRQV